MRAERPYRVTTCQRGAGARGTRRAPRDADSPGRHRIARDDRGLADHPVGEHPAGGELERLVGPQDERRQRVLAVSLDDRPGELEPGPGDRRGGILAGLRSRGGQHRRDQGAPDHEIDEVLQCASDGPAPAPFTARWPTPCRGRGRPTMSALSRRKRREQHPAAGERPLTATAVRTPARRTGRRGRPPHRTQLPIVNRIGLRSRSSAASQRLPRRRTRSAARGSRHTIARCLSRPRENAESPLRAAGRSGDRDADAAARRSRPRRGVPAAPAAAAP